MPDEIKTISSFPPDALAEIRKIVRQEIAIYERKLLRWHMSNQIDGLAQQTGRYEKFIEETLCSNGEKKPEPPSHDCGLSPDD